MFQLASVSLSLPTHSELLLFLSLLLSTKTPRRIVNWLFFEFRVTIQVERTPKLLSFFAFQEFEKKVGEEEERERRKDNYDLEKRNDDDHKSKSLMMQSLAQFSSSVKTESSSKKVPTKPQLCSRTSQFNQIGKQLFLYFFQLAAYHALLECIIRSLKIATTFRNQPFEDLGLWGFGVLGI